MIDAYIYMIVINNVVWPEYGYFSNFDDAKSKAAEIATEYSDGESVEENSWKANQLYIVNAIVIGVIKVDHSSVAEY